MILVSISIVMLLIGIIFIIIGSIVKKKKMTILGSCIILLLAIGTIIFFIYAIEKDEIQLKNQNNESINDVSELKNPDRIIYKNDKNEYIIVRPENEKFSKMYSELYNITKSSIDGVVYSEEELKQIQKEKSFIECDYNTKSRNYIFILNGKEISIIRRLDQGGQVIRNYTYSNDNLMKLLNKIAENFEKYEFEESINYTSKTKIIDFPTTLNFEQKRQGIYQKIMTNDNSENENFLNILEQLSFKNDEKIDKVDFKGKNVIITISRYDINNIKENVGSIKYEFGKMNNNYIVNVLIVSKIPNTNCIYYNISDNSTLNGENDYLSRNINIATSGTIQGIEENKIKIGLGNYTSTYIAKIDKNTLITEYETNKEINMSELKEGDSIYVEGETSIEIDGIKGIQSNKIAVCNKERVKKEVSKYLINTYRIDGPGIVYKSINEKGDGYIIIEGSFEKFIYPIKINVNSQTETYLGMGYHLQSNYGYILHEICNITLDEKITDIDNINGYAKTIEYIAD